MPTNQRPETFEAGLRANWKSDLLAGFLVFLIALPLCLGISLACGFPAVAGIFTAIIGGILTTFLSNSELTIKGPAAGLIVIVLGCMTDFGYTMGKDVAADYQAYRLALGVGAVAAVCQILLGLFRTGILGEFFPLSTVHGMLAAIGIIIIAKQIPVALGTTASGGPLTLLAHIPDQLRHMNPEIALIGAVSLLILFGLPLIQNKYVKKVPAPMLVVLVSIPLGIALNLSHEHTYSLIGNTYSLSQKYLVSVPASLLNALTFPDFSGLATAKAWKWVLMYTLIGSLESMLSAKAIDLIDPWKRKTNLDRDVVAIGVGNLAAALVGGLPMISEIVRSRANIDNGARTRYADLFHGVFLLLAVALLPHYIHMIPLAALAAMLVYTGFRLAHPKTFIQVARIGWEQLVIYSGTILAVLATDLLVGVFTGVALKILIHLSRGLPLKALLKSPFPSTPEDRGDHYRVTPDSSLIFSHWIPMRRMLEKQGLAKGRNFVVDLSKARIVDHTVMEKLHEMERDFAQQNLELRIEGLDEHVGVSSHPLSARLRPADLPGGAN